MTSAPTSEMNSHTSLSVSSAALGREDRLAIRISLASAFLFGIAAVAFILTSFTYPYWQVFFLAASFGMGGILSLMAGTLKWGASPRRRVFLLAPAVSITLIILAALVQNTTLQIALILFLFGTITATGSLQGRARDTAITLAFFSSVLVVLIGTFSPFDQIRLPQFEIYLPVALGILFMLYVMLLAMDYVYADLRIKLLAGSLAIAIAPLIILSLIDSRFIQNALQSQSNQALQFAADQTVAQIEDFLSSNRDAVANAADLPVFANYLLLAPDARPNSPEENELELALNSLATRQSSYLTSFALLNISGDIVYDINPTQIGLSDRTSDYFVETVSRGQALISPVLFSPTNSDAFIVFTSPIRNDRQQLIGVLRLQFDALVLQSLVSQNANLIGSRSNAILLDENYMRLADTLSPDNLHKFLTLLPSTRVSELLRTNRMRDLPLYETHTSDSGLAVILDNALVEPEFTYEFHANSQAHTEAGVIGKLVNMPWSLLFVQEQTALTKLLENQGQLSILISTIIAGIVGLFASVISTIFSTPIIRLQTAAEKISSGDLEAQAQVESTDEIGRLAQAFNTMTLQLKTLINELEDRVRERTRELAKQNESLVFKTRQLQTVSDVARGIVSTQELESLLTQVTSLISERFGFYHVGVFLIDPKGEYAVLRAANSDGGRRMLARQHRLRVGQVGIVGHVTGFGEPRIATDVGKDAVFFNNPDLPMTRSEMALPLSANNRVIGALDVQSIDENAFAEDDIELFSTLADQIAVAIVNNQLFTETVQALEEAQRVHRQYLRQEWARETNTLQRSFLYTPHGVYRQTEQQTEEILEALATGQPVAKPAQPDSKTAVLAVPIKLRGETIGVIHLQDTGMPDRKWSAEEINSINAVADQVGLALENARLLEKTIRRAERERRVLEITSRIRATNDPQSMMEIALQELQRSLNASKAQIILKEQSETDIIKSGNGSPRTTDES